MTYSEFMKNNRIRMNRTMNHVIWICLIAAPILFFCNLIGLWTEISYFSLGALFCLNLIIAIVDTFMIKRWPTSIVASIIGFVAIDMVLVYLAANKLGIYMMFYFVPLLSLVFIDQNLYIIACIWTYIMMFISTWNIAEYHAHVRIDYDEPIVWFISYLSGCTIEMLIMFITGLAICRFMQRYFMEKYDDEQILQNQIRLIKSMNAIYELIILIDYKENKLTYVSKDSRKEYTPDKLDDILWDMSEHIVEEDERLFRIFTNMHSLRGRLSGRDILTAEFRDVEKGWMRGRFMCLKKGSDGLPEQIVFTLHDIDEEKKEIEAFERELKAEHVVDFSDRKLLREDIFMRYDGKKIENMAVFVVDLNELKEVNTKLGTEAGDSYIKGVHDAIERAFDKKGNVFRVGGDEYLAVTETDESAKDIADKIKSICLKNDKNKEFDFSVSVGYASVRENIGCDIRKLTDIADDMLYYEKTKFYSNPIYDRRKG
ncbi:MAG: diguanylate cyclase [Lachnospiraceae bacterium]|nr:diguanylate cyclase [Lachnospiraceae bacterium]